MLQMIPKRRSKNCHRRWIAACHRGRTKLSCALWTCSSWNDTRLVHSICILRVTTLPHQVCNCLCSYNYTAWSFRRVSDSLSVQVEDLQESWKDDETNRRSLFEALGSMYKNLRRWPKYSSSSGNRFHKKNLVEIVTEMTQQVNYQQKSGKCITFNWSKKK